MGLGHWLSKVADYTPIVSNVKGAVQGNIGQALAGPAYSGYEDAKDLANKIKNAYSVAHPPGVGGPAADPSRLVKQADGTFKDPVTNTAYSDATGQTAMQQPNLAQQGQQDNSRANTFLGKIAGSDATMDQVNSRQGALATSLTNTINNVGAPSVAQAQLKQTQDANARQIAGTAAGVGGANAYDARRAAISALSNSNAQTAGNAATLRQQEVASATNSLGNVLNQQGTAAQARSNANVSAGSNFAQQGLTAEADKEKMDLDASKTNQQTAQKYTDMAMSKISDAGTGAGLV